MSVQALKEFEEWYKTRDEHAEALKAARDAVAEELAGIEAALEKLLGEMKPPKKAAAAAKSNVKAKKRKPAAKKKAKPKASEGDAILDEAIQRSRESLGLARIGGAEKRRPGAITGVPKRVVLFLKDLKRQALAGEVAEHITATGGSVDAAYTALLSLAKRGYLTTGGTRGKRWYKFVHE